MADREAIRIALNGAAGRMGRELAQGISQYDDLSVVACWEHADHPLVAGSETLDGIPVTTPFADDKPVDVIVDFTNAAGLEALLRVWRGKAALVTGSTGLDGETDEMLTELANMVPVFHANNMSVGIAVLNRVLARVASELDENWDVELLEMHHNRKHDAPSGTARTLLQTLVEHWPSALKPVYGREGTTGPRKKNELGVFAMRGGDVVGEHEVFFAAPGETLRFKHTASSRAVFVNGALTAVRFLTQQGPGRYGMPHLLESRGDTSP